MKILKEEVEQKCNEIERAQSHKSDSLGETERINRTPSFEIASIWSPSVQSPIKPPHLEIALFDENVLRWQEFWDQFEAAIHNAKFS